MTPLSVDQKLTRSINTDELIASLVPNYSALANLYHSATTVAGSAFDWLKDRLESKNQTVTKQKWEGGRYQAFLKDKKIEQRSKYDKLDPDVLGHYLELFNVIKMAEIGDSPSLKEAYLRSELKTDKKIAFYQQFASMLKQQQDQLNQFYSATLINKLKMHITGSEVSLGNYDPKQVQMTMILDNINQLERQFLAEYQNKTIRPDKINSMTQELAEAINFFLPPLSKANVDQYQLREGFLYVTAEKMMKSYFEGKVKLILEELIDDSPANISLRSIYSKIVNGTLLDRTDIQRLQMEFDRSSQLSADKKSFLQSTLSNMFKLRVSLESNPQYALSNKVELVKTPNEIDIDNIQHYIEKSNLLKIIHEITTHIEVQQNEVIRLKSHITPGTILDELCANKYAYLDEIKRAVDLIKTEMESKDAAKLIHEILTRDSLISMDSTNPLLSLFKLIPTDLANKTTAIEKALFTRIASTISPDRLLKSKIEYERVLAQNKTLELLPFLSDPFKYDDFMQNQEVLVEQLINYLLQEESVKSALETAQKLPGLIFHKAVNEFAKHVVGAIPLGNAVIYSLGAILEHIDVQNLLRNLIDKQVSGLQQLATDQLTDQVKNVSQAILKASPLSQHSDKWTQASFEKTKGYLCKKIGVELRSVMEKNALKYIEHAVVRTEQESEAVEAAFSVFYLQYRAIKAQHKNEDSFNKIDCIKLLFKSIAPHDSVKQNEILATFEKYDKELYNEFEVANSHITSDIDTHLEFLLNHVNLSDEKNHALIKMALFNKLLLMTLEGSKHHHLAPQSIKMETLNAKIDSSLQRLGSIKEESRMIKQYKKAKVMLQEIKNNSPGFQQAPAEIKEAEIKEDATKNQPAGPHAKQT